MNKKPYKKPEFIKIKPLRPLFFDDFEVAEMIYNFCCRDEINDDLVRHDSEDLSLAEFVYQYHFKEFQAYCALYHSVYVQPLKSDLI